MMIYKKLTAAILFVLGVVVLSACALETTVNPQPAGGSDCAKM